MLAGLGELFLSSLAILYLVFEERKIQEAAVVFNVKLKEALQKERESRKTFEESSAKFEVGLTNSEWG